MKHLFYIHSYITYHVALEVISYHKLNHMDCVLMYGRKFVPLDPPAAIQHVDLPFSHHPINSFAVERVYWKGWKKLRKFDVFVQELTNGDKFKLYTNQTGIDFIRLFISHRQCRGFSFLEEGVASYYTLKKINTEICPSGSSTGFFKLLLLLNFRGRLSLEKCFYDSGYEHAYALSDASFPGFERKVKLPFPFHNNLPMPEYGYILVLDATAEYGVTSVESALHALEETLQFLIKKGISMLWVKYHPDQANSEKVKKLYEHVFQRHSEFLIIEEVSQHVSLEFLAGNVNNSTTVFYIFLSSVGLYAGLCGREVYSFASYIAKHDEQYKQRVLRLPDAFKEKVKFL